MIILFDLRYVGVYICYNVKHSIRVNILRYDYTTHCEINQFHGTSLEIYEPWLRNEI